MSYTNLLYHIVFATKARRPFLNGDCLPRLCQYTGGIIRNLDGRLLAVGGHRDHVHLAVSLHPSRALADVVRTVKANSSKWIHETFPGLRDLAWQDGYAAFTVSKSALKEVVRYIETQDDHHRKRSFEDELRALLKKHGIEFDEQYLV